MPKGDITHDVFKIELQIISPQTCSSVIYTSVNGRSIFTAILAKTLAIINSSFSLILFPLHRKSCQPFLQNISRLFSLLTIPSALTLLQATRISSPLLQGTPDWSLSFYPWHLIACSHRSRVVVPKYGVTLLLCSPYFDLMFIFEQNPKSFSYPSRP